ncbi:hypothetical protein BDN67DRAFT_528341 [Paxillus ammoniavirescens]|nr:hypothetical protein BDN67DRAFT_528341 [Paxillus ammoniavirescens]
MCSLLSHHRYFGTGKLPCMGDGAREHDSLREASGFTCKFRPLPPGLGQEDAWANGSIMIINMAKWRSVASTFTAILIIQPRKRCDWSLRGFMSTNLTMSLEIRMKSWSPVLLSTTGSLDSLQPEGDQLLTRTRDCTVWLGNCVVRRWKYWN